MNGTTGREPNKTNGGYCRVAAQNPHLRRWEKENIMNDSRYAAESDRLHKAFESSAVFCMHADALVSLLRDACIVRYKSSHNDNLNAIRANTIQHLLLCEHMRNIDKRAQRIATTALLVSIAALAVVGIQALIAYGIIPPMNSH